jgi:hypothetical protein
MSLTRSPVTVQPESVGFKVIERAGSPVRSSPASRDLSEAEKVRVAETRYRIPSNVFVYVRNRLWFERVVGVILPRGRGELEGWGGYFTSELNDSGVVCGADAFGWSAKRVNPLILCRLLNGQELRTFRRRTPRNRYAVGVVLP